MKSGLPGKTKSNYACAVKLSKETPIPERATRFFYQVAGALCWIHFPLFSLLFLSGMP